MQDIPWDRLFQAAADAKERAYSPYSRFKVGAAVLFEDGTVYSGCNVENSSYGLSICAERNAISAAVLDGRRNLAAVAVVTDTELPCPPCGACRQVMAEFGAADAMVTMRTADGTREERCRLDELLPHAFTKEFL